ncbi:MAG: ATP-dependent DNA helicase RecG [Phycisphaerales bacterium]
MSGAPEGVETRVPAGAVELTTPLARVEGVASVLAADLRALGLTNVGRLIAHLPMRHEREEAEAPIAELAAGAVVSTRGEITATRVAGYGRKRRFEAVLHDGVERLELIWFNAPYMQDKLRPGDRVWVQGKARALRGGLQLANPKWELLDDEKPEPGARESRLRPVYPASERVNSRQIEALIQRVLPRALELIEDHLDGEYRRARELPELRAAYRMLHAPEDESEVEEARRRLIYDELLLLQLGVAMKRAQLRQTLRAPALRADAEVDARIRARFPFTLTPGQEKVVGEIAKDLSSDTPTNRLIQGDVGSGKTLVALYAMLMAVASGKQAALMAPTEILAEQHAESIRELLRGSEVRVAMLTGALPERDRASIHERLASGEIDILVGTHALLTERVRFNDLAVAIIDEQHRFGVHQRASLRAKATVGEAGEAVTPHVLVMTATPIPRTLAITEFGDLDVSTIPDLPPGRSPIETRVVTGEDRAKVYEYVRTRLERGEQAYVVAPAIDAGETVGGVVRDVRALTKELEEGPLQGLRVAALHGRLKRETRERIMGRFREGLIDALVATTVIEVGVDVANASVMVVEHAERFGLAQLHQLRGRVGRGKTASLCVLIGETTTPEAQRRLEVMAHTSSGFELAERDLEIRGPGEMFGARQSGVAPFKIADPRRDRELLEQARRDARAWIEASPGLEREGEALIRRRLLHSHGEALGLGDVG